MVAAALRAVAALRHKAWGKVDHKAVVVAAALERQACQPEDLKVVADVGRVSVDRADRASALVGRKVDRVSALVGRKADQVSALVDRKVDRVSALAGRKADLVSALAGRKADRALALADHKAGRVSALVGRKADQVSALVDRKADRVSALVDRKVDQVSALAEHKADGLAWVGRKEARRVKIRECRGVAQVLAEPAQVLAESAVVVAQAQGREALAVATRPVDWVRAAREVAVRDLVPESAAVVDLQTQIRTLQKALCSPFSTRSTQATRTRQPNSSRRRPLAIWPNFARANSTRAALPSSWRPTAR